MLVLYHIKVQSLFCHVVFQVFKLTDTHSVYLLSDFFFAILVSNYLNKELDKRSYKINLNTKEIYMTTSGQPL